MTLETMTKDQLETLQIATENEYQEASRALTEVEIHDIELAKKIAQLQLERKDLAMALVKGKHNVREISSQLRNIKCMIYKRLGGM